MKIRVAAAFLKKDGKGWYVVHRGNTVLRAGRQKCRQHCGAINKAAAKQRERAAHGAAERRLWAAMHQQEIRDFNAFKRDRPRGGGVKPTGRATVRRGLLNIDNMQAFRDALGAML